MSNKSAWIQTYSGVKFFPLQPKEQDILVPDIAHALSNQCRYGGHCRKFYSVAQHSVLVSNLAKGDYRDPRIELAGLLHDATEAYLVDVPRPVKHQLKEYKPIEDNLHRVIAQRFSLEMKDFETIKVYDEIALVIEAKAIMAPFHPDWITEKQINMASAMHHWLQEPWTPAEAEAEFLKRFHELWMERKV